MLSKLGMMFSLAGCGRTPYYWFGRADQYWSALYVDFGVPVMPATVGATVFADWYHLSCAPCVMHSPSSIAIWSHDRNVWPAPEAGASVTRSISCGLYSNAVLPRMSVASVHAIGWTLM